MNLLDQPQTFRGGGLLKMLGSIQELPNQCEQAWKEAGAIKIPASYKKCKNALIAGMGGSGLGPHIALSTFASALKKPVEIWNDYFTPAWVNEDTLVLLVSYSGSTEETISAAREVGKKTKKRVLIATGGPLADVIEAEGQPVYRFTPIFNPAGVPRMAVGYGLAATTAILSRTGILDIGNAEMKKFINSLRSAYKLYNPAVPLAKNPAKQLAVFLENRAGIFVTRKSLSGVVHATVNQINESAKHFAVMFRLPELNHHLLEGLGFPKSAPKDLGIVFVTSEVPAAPISQRIKLTREVAEKEGYATKTVIFPGKSRVESAAYALVAGEFVSLYLAALHKIDPVGTKWVDYFKKKLAR
ncbi:MAG: bifunctional phosphoglucose/phosphomannose isomerase, glucose/mannose-6-phosphate isomerase [Candidatus Magasanikbacteria bacterium]|nr:bifunctional phosphoglucose/phosphomannose isomerase, glucose/mannose-6-phosphate isomerase [Candidatus Magasanikbacteria bacterium]